MYRFIATQLQCCLKMPECASRFLREVGPISQSDLSFAMMIDAQASCFVIRRYVKFPAGAAAPGG